MPRSEKNLQPILRAVLFRGIGQHEQASFVVLVLPGLQEAIGRGQGRSVSGVGGRGGKNECLVSGDGDSGCSAPGKEHMSGTARYLPDSRRNAGATNSRFTHELCRKLPHVFQSPPRFSLARRDYGGRASSPVALPRGRGRPRHTSLSHEISFASPNAAAAATPPMAMVCNALRAGPGPRVAALQISEEARARPGSPPPNTPVHARRSKARI